MKKLVFTIFIGAFFSGVGIFYLYVSPVDIGERTFSVIIKRGDSFNSVADKFAGEGVVRWRFLLVGIARWMDLDRQLTPGRYDFSGEISTANILARLYAADYVRVKLTLIEGLPLWTVLATIADQMELDSAKVWGLKDDSLLLSELKLPYFEGYLYPETYIFPWGTSAREIISAMVSLHRERVDSLLWQEAPNGLSRDEVIILASIVEAEALLTKEKPLIASVYQNRLARRMKLDADPTVIYGLGGLDRPLSRRDLRKDTPYNTYLRRGLPPTPINSPSLSAIEAVIHPDSTDYLYFVADGTGGHVFTRSNAEHNRAVREIRRAKRDREK